VGDWQETVRLFTEALARELARAEPDAASRA